MAQYIDFAGGGGGAATLAELDDVDVTTILDEEGLIWDDALGKYVPIDYATEVELAAAIAARQPLDGDLTALAALTTTAFGRSVLEVADALGLRTLAGAQASDADLTAIAALTTTAYGRSLLELADAAAGRTLLGLGTAATHAHGDYDSAGAAAAAQAASQPLDSDLTAIAALATTATGRSLLAAADAAAIRAISGAPSVAEAILDTIGDDKGDLIGFSAADTPVKFPKAVSDGLFLKSLAAGTAGFEWGAGGGGAIDWGEVGDIVSIDPDDAASAGVLDEAARADHQHAIVAAAAGAIQPDDAAAEGAATSFARSDHKHAIAAAAAAILTGQNAEGASTSFARADHDHALPDYGTEFGEFITGGPVSQGFAFNFAGFFVACPVLWRVTLTGVRYRVGATAAGAVKSALYNAAGTRVAERTAALNQSAAGANAVQDVAFASTYAAAPGLYWLWIGASLSTSTYCGSRSNHKAKTQTEASHAAPASFTPPTVAHTSNVPFMCTY